MGTSYIMKVSGNGQVSIPAEVRSRWETDQVIVVDLGNRVVMRPFPDDPVGELRGKYSGRGADTDALRRQARREEAASERRR